MIYIGIDPGRYGAMASVEWSHNGAILHNVRALPRTEDGALDVLEFHHMLASFRFFSDLQEKPLIGMDKKLGGIAIEQSQAMPKQGVVSTGKTMEEFGRLFAATTIFCGQTIPLRCPRPRTWQVVVSGAVNAKSPKAKAQSYVRNRYGYKSQTRKKELREGEYDAIAIASWLAKQKRTEANQALKLQDG